LVRPNLSRRCSHRDRSCAGTRSPAARPCRRGLCRLASSSPAGAPGPRRVRHPVRADVANAAEAPGRRDASNRSVSTGDCALQPVRSQARTREPAHESATSRPSRRRPLPRPRRCRHLSTDPRSKHMNVTATSARARPKHRTIRTFSGCSHPAYRLHLSDSRGRRVPRSAMCTPPARRSLEQATKGGAAGAFGD
jgi:hypothetical protein